MYPVSDAFHQAVANGEKQIAMLIFDDCLFTNEDINVSGGIQFSENFNTETDISIGQTPSNYISFSLFNDTGLLDEYQFGQFTATIGVKIGENNYTQIGSVMMTTLYAQYTGHESQPYLKRNGTAMASQPGFPVKSMLAYAGKVWVFGENGQYAVYNDANGQNITKANPVNSFMLEKSKRWEGKGMFYNSSSRMLMIYNAGTRERYEFCPLGVFIANRPNVPDKIEISLTCYDLMQMTEQDMPSASALGISYPTTIGTLFKKICAFLGVGYKTATFINSNADIEKEPEKFSDATIRTVLGWIAEAAGSNVRFDRDGELVIDWLKNTPLVYSEGDYQSFDPYWYETPVVDKLYIRNTDNNSEVTRGNGKVPYLIQDNPFL